MQLQLKCNTAYQKWMTLETVVDTLCQRSVLDEYGTGDALVQVSGGSEGGR